jgi:hypothetical protein
MADMDRRRWGIVALVLVALVVITGWAIPNLAGSALIEVRLVATPTVATGAGTRTVVVGGGQPGSATNLLLSVRITNRYVLPLTIGGGTEPLRIDLRARSADGTSRLVWTIQGSSAGLEPDGESPDGNPASRAYLIDVGTTDYPVGPDGGVALTDGTGQPLQPGSYELRAYAFGVASGSLPVGIVE